MKDNRIELADVVRRFKDRYVNEFGSVMMPSQRRALADIAACMTAARVQRLWTPVFGRNQAS